MATYGSHGDVNPCLGLGRALVVRGHTVTLITSGVFREAAQAEGLHFAELYSVQQHETWARQLTSRSTRGAARLFVDEVAAGLLPPTHGLIETHYRPGKTVLIANWHTFGARIASEALKIPLVSYVLYPMAFRSAYKSRRLPGLALPDWMPPSLKRTLFWLSDRYTDKVVGGPINTYRESRGLDPVRRVLSEWAFSPNLILGFFPAWFAPPQRDWPAQLRLAGFPLYDDPDEKALSQELVDFLEAGPPPLVFTPGTGISNQEAFLKESVETCRLLGRRGLLVARYREQVPSPLPDGVAYIRYAPFSALLPRVAALVHYGGIGTIAQGLAAGIPQLIVPTFNDQPDNAYRLGQLEVSRIIPPKQYVASRVAAVLEELLQDEGARTRCQEIKKRVAQERPFEYACDAIEQFAGEVGLA